MSRVKSQIKDLILCGKLAAGERITEASLADRLGISRTPIRHVLPALAEEGLLVPAGRRGFSVRTYNAADNFNALEIRLALEGMAARALTQRGLSKSSLDQLRDCLKSGDRILEPRDFNERVGQQYADMNRIFHRTIVELTENDLLSALVDRCYTWTLEKSMSESFSSNEQRAMLEFLLYAHTQHHSMVDAIESGDGGRAEALLREHGRIPGRSDQLRADNDAKSVLSHMSP
ncbi:GntR family transcriptional regulator [Pseudorhodoplanes sp.]|uniref:GntR family transcriptional regulator n=1 Tax=Pseudorhodoplanes sp. TaxID=1934341 RepID=UPI003D0D385E